MVLRAPIRSPEIWLPWSCLMMYFLKSLTAWWGPTWRMLKCPTPISGSRRLVVNRAGSIRKKPDTIRIAIRTYKAIRNTYWRYDTKVLVITNVWGNNVIIKQHINILWYSLMIHHLKNKTSKERSGSYRNSLLRRGYCKVNNSIPRLLFFKF